jgi:hypothetical protein
LNAGLAAQTAALNAGLAAQTVALNAALAPVNQALALILAAQAAGAAGAVVAAAATIQAIVAARARNAHDRRGEPYEVVPLYDGTQPFHWPAAGLVREDLVEGPIGPVDALLLDYGIPGGPPLTLFQRRNALARHLGTLQA